MTWNSAFRAPEKQTGSIKFLFFSIWWEFLSVVEVSAFGAQLGKKHTELRAHRAKNQHGDLVCLLQVLNVLYMADNSVPNLKKICIAHPIQGNYLEAASTYLVQLWNKKWISKNLFCQWIIQSNYFASQDSSVNRSPTIPNITRILNKALIAFTTGCRPRPAFQRI